MLSLRRWGRRTGLPAAVGLGLVLLAACGGNSLPQAEGTGAVLRGGGPAPSTTGNPAATPRSVVLRTEGARQSPGVVAAGGPGAPYNYAPSVLRVGGRYRMWWCSQLPGAARPGDQILYADSASLDGPFAGPDGAPADEVFGNNTTGFDTLHTCDPSVIAVNGTYYLYYTGTADPAGDHNAIGLATSPDGIHWTRANGGAPIVTAAGEVQRANAYGVGQPSAVYRDGWFYLMFTDTTAGAADTGGAGQFVLRSPDPAFGGGVQSLGVRGFEPVPTSHSPRSRSVLSGFTADLMWVDALNAFAIANDIGTDTTAGTTISFWDADFRYQPYQPLLIGGPEQEGPGLVRRADGHALVSGTDPCGRVSFDVVRATGSGAGPTGLAHFGVDATGLAGCQTREQAVAVLDGFAMPSPDRTVDLLVNGAFVRIERRSVAVVLAAGMLAEMPPALAGLPVTAQVNAGVPAVQAPGRPVGLTLRDGRLYPVDGAEVAALNSSAVTPVTTAQWDGYRRGSDLADLRP